MTHETPLDTLDAVAAHYRDILLNHPIHHSEHNLNNALLFPLNQTVTADHAITADRDMRLEEYLGKDVRSAHYHLFSDLVDQLDNIRKATFTRDHESYSANGYPERDALNPKGKPSLTDLIQKVGALKEMLHPARSEPVTHGEIEQHKKDIKEMARTIGELRVRYENALTPPPRSRELLSSRQELLAYSSALVESMHRTVFAALGTERGVGASR